MREEVTLSAFDPASHLAMVNRWLLMPHVLRWREEPLEAKLLAFSPAGEYAVIVHGAPPVG